MNDETRALLNDLEVTHNRIRIRIRIRTHNGNNVTVVWPGLTDVGTGLIQATHEGVNTDVRQWIQMWPRTKGSSQEVTTTMTFGLRRWAWKQLEVETSHEEDEDEEEEEDEGWPLSKQLNEDTQRKLYYYTHIHCIIKREWLYCSGEKSSFVDLYLIVMLFLFMKVCVDEKIRSKELSLSEGDVSSD